MSVWFITGASTGLGRALAESALAAGHQAAATARRPEALSALADTHGDAVLPLRLDVTDADSIAQAVEAARAKFGRIDVLVNNAGFGMVGAVEETGDVELRRIFDTNFFGALAVTRAVLPHLRAQRGGHILNVSSVGGFTALFPGFGAYCATKFALEAESEALSLELKPFGVHVTIVEPGAFRTEFGGGANARPAAPVDAYREQIGPVAAWMEGISGQQPGDPQKAAEAMLRVTEAPDPPLRLLLGEDALAAARQKLDRLTSDFKAWEEVTLGTNFPGVTAGAIGG